MAPAYPKTMNRSSPRGSNFHEPSGGRSAIRPRPNFQSQFKGPDFTAQFRGPRPEFPKGPELGRAALRLGRSTALRYLNIGADLYNMGKYWYNPYPSELNFVSMGFTRNYSCNPPGGPMFPQWSTVAAHGGCLIMQAGDATQSLHQTPTTTHDWRTVTFQLYSGCPAPPPPQPISTCLVGSRRFNWLEQWTRPAGLPNKAAPHFNYAAFVVPRVNPFMNPDDLPIQKWVPLAKPLPYSQVDQARKAHERTTIPPIRFQPSPVAAPVVSADPAQHPLADNPGVRIQMFPAGAGGFGAKLPGRHADAVPPKGTRERKFILSPHKDSPIAMLANLVTESDDFVTALYFAIPKHLRPKGRVGLHKKAEFVYKHFRSIDIEDAFNNLLRNQVGDAIGGFRGRLNAKANRATGVATGLRLPH